MAGTLFIGPMYVFTHFSHDATRRCWTERASPQYRLSMSRKIHLADGSPQKSSNTCHVGRQDGS